MPKKRANANPLQRTYQVELAIGRLDSLSSLPCVAVQFFPKLWQGRFSPAGLAVSAGSVGDLAASWHTLLSSSFFMKHN